MKYRHYAPDSMLLLFKTGYELVDYLKKSGLNSVSIMISLNQLKGVNSLLQNFNVIQLYTYDSSEELGENLFSKLREMDRNKTEAILIQFNDTDGFGKSILNRLKKAAS